MVHERGDASVNPIIVAVSAPQAQAFEAFALPAFGAIADHSFSVPLARAVTGGRSRYERCAMLRSSGVSVIRVGIDRPELRSGMLRLTGADTATRRGGSGIGAGSGA